MYAHQPLSLAAAHASPWHGAESRSASLGAVNPINAKKARVNRPAMCFSITTTSSSSPIGLAEEGEEWRSKLTLHGRALVSRCWSAHVFAAVVMWRRAARCGCYACETRLEPGVGRTGNGLKLMAILSAEALGRPDSLYNQRFGVSAALPDSLAELRCLGDEATYHRLVARFC